MDFQGRVIYLQKKIGKLKKIGGEKYYSEKIMKMAIVEQLASHSCHTICLH